MSPRPSFAVTCPITCPYTTTGAPALRPGSGASAQYSTGPCELSRRVIASVRATLVPTIQAIFLRFIRCPSTISG